MVRGRIRDSACPAILLPGDRDDEGTLAARLTDMSPGLRYNARGMAENDRGRSPHSNWTAGTGAMIQLNSHFTRTDLETSEPEFAAGDVVRHRRYGYRGVVVAVDAWCRADPQWYLSNATQPDREQPWYHVLVDSSEQVTYPAEENLVADRSGLPIRHRWLSRFFCAFEDGRYIRNEAPWPA
jgi:heat shock protein HspQ